MLFRDLLNFVRNLLLIAGGANEAALAVTENMSRLETDVTEGRVSVGVHFEQGTDLDYLKTSEQPGEAVVARSGFLVTSVLDLVHNEIDVAIVDAVARGLKRPMRRA